ncbi:MAG: hypothetical protein ACOWWM_18455 [Desulfobacterales bacterium]
MNGVNLQAIDQKELHERRKYGGQTPACREDDFRRVREGINEAWGSGDIESVLAWMDNSLELAFVFDNHAALLARGLYERALINAYQDTRSNFLGWTLPALKFLFNKANPEKLRAEGDPMPERERYTLYRGVSGKRHERRVSGISWTDSMETARWFANRFDLLGPAVYTITVSADDILAYLNGRNESEYLLRLPPPKKPRRIG